MFGTLAVGVVAFAMVFLALGILAAVMFLLRAIAYRRAEKTAPLATEDSPELLAILTAAARSALGRPIRIHHVHIHQEAKGEVWTRAGRLDVMFSHRLGRRP